MPHQGAPFSNVREKLSATAIVPAIATTAHAANDAMATEQLTILRASVLNAAIPSDAASRQLRNYVDPKPYAKHSAASQRCKVVPISQPMTLRE